MRDISIIDEEENESVSEDETVGRPAHLGDDLAVVNE